MSECDHYIPVVVNAHLICRQVHSVYHKHCVDLGDRCLKKCHKRQRGTLICYYDMTLTNGYDGTELTQEILGNGRAAFPESLGFQFHTTEDNCSTHFHSSSREIHTALAWPQYQPTPFAIICQSQCQRMLRIDFNMLTDRSRNNRSQTGSGRTRK